MLLLVFGVKLRWLPILGYVDFRDSPLGWAQHIFLPALSLAAFVSAVVLRQIRAGMIDTLESRYVLAAWARGGNAVVVIGKHALRNGSLPALTAFGVQVAALLGGTVIVEQIFSIPGMGQYLLTAIKGRDLPVIQASILLFVVCQVAISLTVDIAYGFLNPKVRVG
jgi:peptide/nickel transport system permease protein